MNELLRELYKKYKYKTELHAHTSGASACASLTPEEVVRLYAAEGYSSLAFTNHFDFGLIKNEEILISTLEKHLSDFEKGKKQGEKLGVHVIFATELRFPGDINDFLFYGPGPDFYRSLEICKTRTLEDFVKNYNDIVLYLLYLHFFYLNYLIHIKPVEN